MRLRTGRIYAWFGGIRRADSPGVAAHSSSPLAGITDPASHPVELFGGPSKGAIPSPMQSTVVANSSASGQLTLVVVLLMMSVKRLGKEAHVDTAARYYATKQFGGQGSGGGLPR